MYHDTFFSEDIKASAEAVKMLDRFAAYAAPFDVRLNVPEVWQYTDANRVACENLSCTDSEGRRPLDEEILAVLLMRTSPYRNRPR